MKYLIVLQLAIYNLLGFTHSQLSLLQQVYTEAKKYKSHNGFSFEKTVCAIYLTESSAGIRVVGDQYTSTGRLKPLYISSLGPGQIKLHTALIILHKYPKLKKKFRIRSKSIETDNRIINLLLTNTNFSVAISSKYLIMNYEIAQRRHMWNPYLKAISHYNGGWLNYVYIHRVMKNLVIIKKLIKKGIIK